MTFTKRENGGYSVKSAGEYVGSVFKEAQWTVRGDRIRWIAVRKGQTLGIFENRQEAGAYLVNRK